MDYLKLSWDDIAKQTKKIAKDLDGKQPDAIVGVSRGGLVPMRLLSDLLGVKLVDIIRIEHYNEIGAPKTRPIITITPVLDLQKKKILLVDDVADTGETLQVAKKYIEQKGAAETTTACLVKKPSALETPDLFAKETGKWVIFPWELGETDRGLREKYSGKELIKELKKAKLK